MKKLLLLLLITFTLGLSPAGAYYDESSDDPSVVGTDCEEFKKKLKVIESEISSIRALINSLLIQDPTPAIKLIIEELESDERSLLRQKMQIINKWLSCKFWQGEFRESRRSITNSQESP